MDDDDDDLSGRAGAPDDLTEADFAAMMGDTDAIEITTVGPDAAPPIVPSLPDRPHVDRGPGGSLLEQATITDRDRQRIRWALDPRIWVAVLCLLATPVVIVWAAIGWASGLPGWLKVVLFVAIGLIGVLAALVFVSFRLRPSQPAQQLIDQARLEHQIVRAARMPSPYWSLLSDRLLPDTEHRLPLIAAGPAGVVIFPILPAGPYDWSEDSVLVADGVALGPWLRTRMWEVRSLLSGLAQSRAGRWPFSGPVHCVIVDPYPPRMVRGRDGEVHPAPAAPPGPPRVFAEVPIVPTRHIGDYLAGLPSTLPAHVVADLRAQVEQLCPPAPQGYPDTLPS